MSIEKRGTLTLGVKPDILKNLKGDIDIASIAVKKKDKSTTKSEQNKGFVGGRQQDNNIAFSSDVQKMLEERRKSIRQRENEKKEKVVINEKKEETSTIEEKTNSNVESNVPENQPSKKVEEKKLFKNDVDVFNTLKDIVQQDKAKKEKEQARLLEEKKQKEVKAELNVIAKIDLPQKEEKSNDSFAKKIDKPKAKFKNNNDEEEEFRRRKKKFDGETEHRRGNIHTYIINNDDEEGFFRRKKTFKKKKSQDSSQQEEHRKIIQEVILPEFITVSDLAERMNEQKSAVVKKLLTMGMPVTVNQTIDADTAELIVGEFGHTVKRVTEADIESYLGKDEGTEFVSRAPIVTIMGHVDHGKTSLLDAIRSTHVAEHESGGITQHIGASRVEVDGKYITFIDTPGHEAFTEMRMRGANITDIVVLVVAADDGIQNQTIEAIHHAKAAKVPIIVAINKIDKVGADPSRVKNELLQYEVVSEEFGGDTMFVEVSAKQGLNLDKLREAILLQAEILDLKAPIDVPPCGAVIESRVDPNKGVIATLLVQKGILKIGDIVIAGTSYGKIKRMVNDKRKPIEEATPSVAVEVLGLDKAPNAGDTFYVVKEDKEARDIVAFRERKERDKKNAIRQGRSIESILRSVGDNKKELTVIVKADVNGSIEAIAATLTKLNTEEASVNIVHTATGAINETDVNLAAVSNALIVGFNVRANNGAKNLAHEKGIEIRYYSIIYSIVDDVKALLSGMLDPVEKEEHLGQAEIRQVFKVTGVGKVAGCYVTEGEIQRNANIRLIRDSVVIFDGKIKVLKRFKDDVKEVKNGYECGLSIENYDDIKEKDVIECYKIVEEKRAL